MWVIWTMLLILSPFSVTVLKPETTSPHVNYLHGKEQPVEWRKKTYRLIQVGKWWKKFHFCMNYFFKYDNVWRNGPGAKPVGKCTISSCASQIRKGGRERERERKRPLSAFSRWHRTMIHAIACCIPQMRHYVQRLLQEMRPLCSSQHSFHSHPSVFLYSSSTSHCIRAGGRSPATTG